jgi:hypothetical protein
MLEILLVEDKYTFVEHRPTYHDRRHTAVFNAPVDLAERKASSSGWHQLAEIIVVISFFY